MALGGFYRLVKVNASGHIVDHRPLTSDDPYSAIVRDAKNDPIYEDSTLKPEWQKMYVPKGMALETHSPVGSMLEVRSGKMAKRAKQPERLARWMKQEEQKQHEYQAAELEQKRINLEALNRPEAALRAAQERDRKLQEADSVVIPDDPDA
jgi:hypothetical protein